MKKFKLQKNKVLAVIVAGVMSSSVLAACSKKKDETKNISPKTTTVVRNVNTALDFSSDILSGVNKEKPSNETGKYATEKQIYSEINTNIDTNFSDLTENIKKNTSLILLLDIFAPENEYGKIDSSIISEFKSRIDIDTMMEDFYSFVATVESEIEVEDKFVRVSDILPDVKSDQKQILSKIEDICLNIKNLSSDSKNSSKIQSEFKKIYDLFVDEEELEVDGLRFSVRDLDYGNRAVAAAYARAASYYARSYITDKQINDIDNRTNDQNNKAQIKIILEVLNNSIIEKSTDDVNEQINTSVKELGEFDLNISDDNIKNIINILNIDYLMSDKVSTVDERSILGKYDDEEVKSAIDSITAISLHNINNKDNLVIWSEFLTDSYKTTEQGKIDSLALDYVLFNTVMLNNTVKSDASDNEILNNPYFKNLKLYISKQDFVQSVERNGKVENTPITFKNIGEGTKFVCDIMVISALAKYPEFSDAYGFTDVAQSNFNIQLQQYQNIVMDECKKIDDEYVIIK